MQQLGRYPRREDTSYGLIVRTTLMIGKRTISQQLRLLRRDRVTDRNIAVSDHLGVDAALVVAEPAASRPAGS